MKLKKGLFKRAVSFALAAAMMLSNIPLGVFAQEAGETEAVSIVAEENAWNSKSAVFIGDSITAGTGTEKIYYEYLEESLGFGSVTAMGVPGSCISTASDYGQSNQPLINRYQSIPSADLIVVFMGTNDYGHETPLGTVQDTGDGTFYGALNTVVTDLNAKYPSSKIVFVTPIHRYGFGTSKILGTKFTHDNIPNGVGASLSDYANAVKTVCANNGVTVIDLHTECMLDPSDTEIRANYMPDGLHPNAAGHEVIAGIMESHIRGYEPVEGEPVVQTEMIQGNKFAAGNNQPCRASSRVNYYLKAGTVITLEDSTVMQWACAKTSDENSTNNLGYFPDAQWTDKETAVVEADGWVGFTFKYRDETKVFDLSKPLSDYITIEEPHYHTYENGICTGCGATASPYLQQLPENIVGCTNLYDSLVPVKGYYTATKYDTSNGAVLSVVIPVEPGDRIAASSFGAAPENMGPVDGIRVTYLLGDKIVTSLSAGDVYNGYKANGFITVPDGVDAACIPWWKPSDSNWLTLSQINKDFVVHSPKTVSAQAPTCTEKGYTAGEICEICNASLGEREEIAPTGHAYNGDVCTVCGAVNICAILDGKYVSVLGDSISTFNGYSNDATVNTTIGGNGPRYDAGTADTKPGSYCLLESVDDTWWMHFANRSGMELLVNNSWAGSQVFGGQTSDGRVIPAAYLDRCVNLHDNTLDNNPGNAPIYPDVIFVYLGINDYNFNRSKVGSGTVDYGSLVSEDGTYVIPATFGEAYGIMLHKMRNAYPNAQIFAMTLLPENLYSLNMTAWEQHNTYIRAAAEYYDIPVVDLAEKCAITWENYSGYVMDKIHPTTAGMKLISDCIETELVAYYKDNPSHTHSYVPTVTAPTCTEQGYTTYTCDCGDSYIGDYVDALGHTYENGTCTVCGNNESSNSRQADNFRWEIINGELAGIANANFSPNAVTVIGGSITNGVISSGRYQLAKTLSLLHDQPWTVEWRGSGDWTGMLMATTPDAYNAGLPYFFKTGTDSGLVAFGYKNTQVDNYGCSLNPLGLDYTQSHTYRLENRIHQNGSNMVYLLVDNVEVGPMNGFYIGGSDSQNQTVDWLSGKDFSMSALGTSSHPINGLKLEYLQVMESGHTHSYEAVVTAPTCTEQGYTTYICNCGASYVVDHVDAVWHNNENGSCSMCGCAMARITRDDITPSVGTVSSLDGTVNTTITTGWYWDIPIPAGAKQVRYMNFKTAANWGSAFLNGTTYISGVCEKVEGNRWVTVEVPEGATVFRYGYITDAHADKNGRPKFQYVEFSDAERDPSQYMPRPATGCHSFSVKVNIAPAMGDPDGYSVGTDYGYIMLPTNYTPYGEPTRLIIVCHGAGGKRSTYQSDSWKTDQNTFWTDMGYAIMDMAACPQPLTSDDRAIHYGNPTVVDCYKAGFDYVMEHFNLKQDGIYVIGTSMGGLSSFQIAQSGKFPVVAQVGFCPAIDLFKQAYCVKWGSAERDYQKSHISSYFGFEGVPASFTNTFPTDAEIELYKKNFEKTVNYSPILRNVVDGDIATIFDVIPTSAAGTDAAEAAIYAKFTATHPCPVMIIHSTDDSVVPYRYSQYFVDMLKRSGQDASLYTVNGVNHMAWQYGKNCTLQGLNGQITIKESQYEAYKFFEKFEKHDEHLPWVDPAVEATCTETGLTEGKHCASCGEILVKQTVVDALGHDYNAVVTAPTCTEQGYTTYTCTCGDEYVADFVDAKGHTYENGICTGCGEAHPNLANLKGKVISIMGDSISTFAGYIPVADGFNLAHRARYPQSNLLTDVNETWWMQAITALDAKLGINDSWAGSRVANNITGNSGDYGENAAMASMTRILNLGANGTPDVILFYGGTNDIAYSLMLGSFNPATAPTEVDLTATKWNSAADAYVAAILRMQHFYPNAKIIAMLPTYTVNHYSDAKLAQFNEIYAAICEHYGVTCIDLRDCGITTADLPDGIHPDANGMDYITEAVLTALLEENMEPGETIVYSVKHTLTDVQASLGYYKGIRAGQTFAETLTGDNLTVTVMMGGEDITDTVCQNGEIRIASVTGDLVIMAKGQLTADGHLQQLPESFCSGTNLWTALKPENKYYTSGGWGNLPTNDVWSITIPVSAGDHIYASSFRKYGENGNNYSTDSGIRVTYFDANGALKTMTPTETYNAFKVNGYLTVPENVVAINIPMWTVSDENAVYILNKEHSYENGICAGCGAKPIEYVSTIEGTYINSGMKNAAPDSATPSYCIDKYRVTPGYEVLIRARIGQAAYCAWVDADGNRSKALQGNSRSGVNVNQILTVPNGAMYLEVSYSVNYEHYIGERRTGESYGAQIGLLGDSIAANGGFLNTMVSKLCFSSGKNVAIGGWFYSEDTGVNGEYPGDATHGIYRQIQNLTGNENVIVLWAGTNDFGHSHKIGTMFDDQGQPNLDVTTFYGGMHRAITDLHSKFGEDIPIIICTPLHRNMPDGGSVGYPYSSESANKLGNYLSDYVEAMIAIADYYDLLVFDSDAETKLNPNDESINSKYFSDGLHPNAAGHAVIGEKLAQFIVENLSAQLGYSYEAVVTPPTCTEKGYTTYTCACGDSYIGDMVAAPGHDFSQSFTCAKCNHVATVSILGDSISTYSGVSVVKNAVYPNATVKSVEDTWWKQVINMMGAQLLVNNASGGSRILSDEYFNGGGIRNGNHAAWRDRCVNLHDGEEKPDVIFVFMGTNDFSYHVDVNCEKCQVLLKCPECTAREDGNLNVCATCRAASGVYSSFCRLPLGTADGVDLSAEVPASTCEAYAVMLSKMKAAYPNAQIYCMSLLPRVNPYQNGTYHDHGQPAAFNAELKKVAECAGAKFISLEQSIDNSSATWSTYFGDAVHPTATGMDRVSETVIAAVLGKEVHTVSAQITGDGITLTGASWAIDGTAYEASVVVSSADLKVDIRVSMNGTDITETAFDAQMGKIHISKVTGNILITVNVKGIVWSIGTVSTINGSDADDYKNRIRTNYIALDEGVTVRTANDAEVNVVYYDGNYNILSSDNNTGWLKEWNSANAPEAAAYIRVVARATSGANLSTEYGKNIAIICGHVHQYESVVTAPTCTEKGYTTYTCACGDSYVDSYVDATGHSFANGVCTSCGFSKKPYQRLTYFAVNVEANGKIYTDNAVLYLPKTYSPNGEPVKLVIYCKQGASQITASYNPIEEVGFYNYLISLGYAVLGVDGVPDAWRDELGLGERAVGNPMAVQGTEKAYDYVIDNYNIAADGCFISGYSQGGHYAQNVIDLTDIPILAAAEQSPVCSMQYHQWDLNATQTVGGVKFTKAARLNVARIYGFPAVVTNAELLNLPYDASLVEEYDPWVRNSQNIYTGFVQKSNLWYLPEGTNLDDIPMTHTAKCPVKIWCAEDDTVISADVMKVFVKAIQNAGGVAEISVVPSGGHGFFQSQTAVGTFTENEKTYKTLPIAVEIGRWFEQYGGYACKHHYSDNVCSVCGMAQWDTDGNGVLEILAIGNSFSVDALEYAYQIAQNLGVEKIVLGNLYIGNCSLNTHVTNAAGDLAKYTYYYNENGTWQSTNGYKISKALESRSWDYVSLQQASAYSGVESTYNGDLTNLIAYVQERSDAKLVWHMTWAYQQDSTHNAFPTYGKDQMTMYNAIVSAVRNKIVTNSNFDLIVPNGTAVQNSRTSLLGDTTTRDGYHMSKDYGRYLTGLMFIKTVTGLSVDGITFAPSSVGSEEKVIAIESVNNAYILPFAVTDSMYVAEIPDEGYVLLKPELTKNGYWNPTDAEKYNQVITDANNSKYYFATSRFTKEELPAGSIIVLESGWQYRPDGWIDDTVQSSRANTTTNSYTVVTEEWWGEYTFRGFNVSKIGLPSLENVTKEDVWAAFRIYMPEEKHSHIYSSVVTAPTCTERGYTTHTCECGNSYVDTYVDALGHEMGDWIVVEEATCTEDGEKRKDCSRCDHFETETIEATGHKYEAVVTAPTCTEKGYTTHTCHCGDSYVDSYMDALDHKWDDGVVTKEPTEETEGTKLFTCERCGETEEETLPKLDHVHAYTSVVTEPTCTEKGYTTHTCECGDSYVDAYVDTLGHDMGDWIVTEEATCTENGEKRSDCARCDHFETEVIEAPGHIYESVVTDPTCTEMGYTTRTCKCGDSYTTDEFPDLGHMWDDGIIIKEPTEETEGAKLFTCERCSATKEETLPKLDHVHQYTAVVTAPTCTEKGYTTHTCECGNSYVDTYVDAMGHDMGEWAVTKEATCTEDGEKRRDCSRCDHFETETIEATGHQYESAVTDPTCTEQGYTTNTCSCGDSYVDTYVDALDHKWDAGVITKEPTEDEEGTKLFTCERCGETREETLPKLDHVHAYTSVVTDPTCTEKGYTTHTCSCGNSYVDTYVDALDHKWDAGVVTKEPTEDTTGTKLFTCERCGETKEETLPKLDHVHAYTSVVTDPTCTERGYTTHTCECGDSYVDTYVDALGHDMGAWENVTEASCTADGSKRRDCERCDHFETEVIKAPGHKYESVVTDPTCTEQGYTTHTCKCGDSYVDSYVDALDHDMGEWIVTEEATCTEDGSKRRDCSRCAHFETETIEATGHNYEAVVTEAICTEKGYTTYTCHCGDCYVDTYVEALGHMWDDGVITKEPTEEATGTKLFTCERCGETREEPLPELDHVHAHTSVVNDPTCTEKGYTTHTCHCGDSYVDTYVDALGHKWDDGVVTKEPTEETEGTKLFTCKHCGETKEETLPKLDHVHAYTSVVTDPTCTEQGYTTHTCKCGDSYVDSYVDALDHKWDAGVITKEPTEDAEGTKVFTCERCGETKEETLPKLDHVHEYNSVVTEPTYTEKGFTTHTCSCGDSYVDSYVDPLPLPEAEVAVARMILGNELAMQFAFLKENIAEGVEYVVSVTKTYADGREDKNILVPQNEWKTNGPYYYVSFNGIAAKEMGDTINAQILTADGATVGGVYTDSVRDYAIRQLRKTTDAKTRTLYVDMLNYGAAAQSYFGYDAEDLVTKDLTETEKGYGTKEVKLENNLVKGEGYAASQLNLASSIQLRVKFNGIDSSMYTIVKFTNHMSREIEARVEGSEFMYSGTVVVIDDVVAADYDRDVTITVYDANGTEVANAVESVASYIARMSGGAEIYSAVAKYCAAAYGYLHK